MCNGPDLLEIFENKRAWTWRIRVVLGVPCAVGGLYLGDDIILNRLVEMKCAEEELSIRLDISAVMLVVVCTTRIRQCPGTLQH